MNYRTLSQAERCARLACAYDPYPNDPNPPEPTPAPFPYHGLAIAGLAILAMLAIGASIALGVRTVGG